MATGLSDPKAVADKLDRIESKQKNLLKVITVINK